MIIYSIKSKIFDYADNIENFLFLERTDLIRNELLLAFDIEVAYTPGVIQISNGEFISFTFVFLKIIVLKY